MEKSRAERRKHQRFKVKEVVFVLMRTNHQNAVAQLIDISESGLGCHFISRNHKSIDYPELEIVLAEDSYHLVKISSRTITDLETDEKLPFNLKKRRYGLEFIRLNTDQRFKLQYFIKTHIREAA